MLQLIREKAKGWIAWVIVGLISIPFALWGINYYFDGPSDPVVARVDDAEITRSQYERAFQSYQRRLVSIFGADADQLANSSEVKNRVMNSLVDEQLMFEFAQTEKIRVTEKELMDQIRDVSAFYDDDVFSLERYNEVLRYQGINAEAYEAQTASQIVMNKPVDSARQSGFITQTAQESWYRLAKESRTVEYVRLDTTSYLSDVELTDQEVESYFQEQRDAYFFPEKVRVHYVELNRSALDSGEISKTDLSDYFQNNASMYQVDERRKIRHILLKADSAALAQELYEKLQSDTDFEELVTSHSQDLATRSSGGELGYVSKDELDEPLASAVFALENGQVTQPVETEFGFQLVKVTEIQPIRGASFDEVRDQVEADVRNEQQEAAFIDLSERLADVSYESSDSLEPVSDELGLTIKKSDWIVAGKESSDEVLNNGAITTAIFSDDVHNRGNNSEVIELTSEKLIVLRVAAKEPRRLKSLTEAKADVELALKSLKAYQLAKNKADEALKQLNEGKTLGDLATELGVAVIESDLSRNSPERDADPQYLQSVFAARQPSTEQKRSYWLHENTGSSVFVSEYKSQFSPTSAAMLESDKTAIQRLHQDNEATAFVDSVRGLSEIWLADTL